MRYFINGQSPPAKTLKERSNSLKTPFGRPSARPSDSNSYNISAATQSN